MMKKFLLTVAYDGSNYHGWQKQVDKTFPTVEEALEKALSVFFKQPITCVGASRTDRGVHALGQRVTIDVNTTVPVERVALAMRSFLPEDISIVDAIEVDAGFHPRYHCLYKTYEYKVYNAKFKNPIFRNFSEFNHSNLDIIAMDRAGKFLIGTHDFKAFAAAGLGAKTTVRTIFNIEVKEKNGFIVIEVTGDGFLYNMVRIIAGTLIMVGEGRIPVEAIPGILQSLDRTRAGRTACAQGLTLREIKYEKY
ncbi:MAG: tRNA pseudouridine(38-40) synthase TruA [Anaerotignaceae bacterium]